MNDCHPRTAEEVLALPTYEAGLRKIICRCGNGIHIPYMAELRAHYVSPTDILVVVDQDGLSWTPVNTEFGWKRRRLSTG